MLEKVTIKTLEAKSPPLDRDGGRIITPTGEIAQIVSGSKFQFLAYIDFEVSGVIPRGNHYHILKEEYFYIIKGNLVAIYEDVESKERAEVTLEAGNLVRIKPKCAHVYFPIEYSQLVEFSEIPFDPNDTYRYIVQSSWTHK